ncbi:MAG: endolytic transglycosylase MltG [Chloroflexi bacterium]|nr:endolytic transglycosylase MltG [Chloroflexota bacterium]MYC55796.1 endolytic transglycosylase MltG [Chloroflexota bacterium]MYE80054.1 endolytic transglycosylase MltG [Chloroflexota bacterium]MYH64124.1 endolytic transglycosylase MltG [Chloroflexota bacterium]
MRERLGAATRGCGLGCLGLALALSLLLGLGWAISDGQLLDLAQRALLRAQLQGRQSELRAPFGDDDSLNRFSIPPGATAKQIAADLVAAALIGDAALFLDYARVEGYDRQFEAGVYFVKASQSIVEIAALLTDSSRSFILFRSREGARIEELAELIDSNGMFAFSGADFLALVGWGAAIPADFAAWAGIPAGASLEGYLFPDTYQLPPDISAAGLRDTLLRAFRERVGDELRNAALAREFTLRQVVTLASIVEREAVWRDEHASIAGVYHNRLSIGMRLEADPTVQYALQGARGAWWGQISQADYRQVTSPYNTYLSAGLPPGPIASPSLSAIQAAIYPAESDYLFFRAACDGSHRHQFARNYEEHLSNAC